MEDCNTVVAVHAPGAPVPPVTAPSTPPASPAAAAAAARSKPSTTAIRRRSIANDGLFEKFDDDDVPEIDDDGKTAG